MKRRALFIAFGLSVIGFLPAQTDPIPPSVVLVDFGATANANAFGIPGWTTALVSPNATPTSAGPGGLTSSVAFDSTLTYYPYAGVTGPMRSFVYGDRIQATWYNNSDSTVSIQPLISFDDRDSPSTSAGQPQWHTMLPATYTLHNGAYNTEQPAIRLAARATVTTILKILDGTTESAIATSAGQHSVVNISLRNQGTVVPAGALVLDKIELFHDVDTTPPAAVSNVSVHAEANNKVHMTWTPPADNVAVTGYRIYRDGRKLYRLDHNASEYTDSYARSGQTYTYRIVPFDAELNEGPSQSWAITLPAVGVAARLIDPANIEYLGAFRVPEDGNYAYSAKGLAYYPAGDPGSDPTDPQKRFPGSLFTLGHINYASISELSIPVPVISAGKNVNDLPSARTLQPLTAVTARPTAVWPMMNIGFLPAQGPQTAGKIYTAYYDQYTFSKHTVFGWCETTLAAPEFHGFWSAGPLDAAPEYFAACRFLFEIPQDWSDANMPGYRLMTGYYRPGALNGYGPSLYAIAPWRDGNPPAAGAALSTIRVLQYGPFSTDTSRPHKMDGFSMHDRIWDAEWLTAGNASAVAIIADKVYGDSWYGNPSGALWTRILHNVPSCDENHGWQGTELRPTIMMFDPNDLADVVQGRKQAWEPQPYAVVDLHPYMFNTAVADHQVIGGVGYDKTNNILYVEENWGDSQRSLLIHVFRINSAVVGDTYAVWRLAHFGQWSGDDTISGPLADPDAAGVANFQRYAFDLPARGPVANPVTLGTAETAGGRVLTLTFNRRAAASGLSYVVESSDDLVTWTTVPGQTYQAGTPASVTAQDSVAMGAAVRRFLRLRILTTP